MAEEKDETKLTDEQLAAFRDAVAQQTTIVLEERAAKEAEEKTAADKAQADKAQADADGLGNIINPYVEKARKETAFEVQNVRDELIFYRDNPEAVERREEVEALFTRLVKEGRPIPRESIHDSLVGQSFKADPDKFLEEQGVKRTRALARAAEGADAGIGGLRHEIASGFENPDAMSDEDLKEALANVTF